MSHKIKHKIAALKDQFEKIDQEEFMVEGDLAANVTALHLAIASHTLNTLTTSMDQIFVCFEISKTMFFYADSIVQNPDFWDEENDVNRMLASNNIRMAEADIDFCAILLNHEIALLQAASVPDQKSVKETLGLVERYQQLVGCFHDAASILTELDGRRQTGRNLYDHDQCPDLKGVSAEHVLKQLNFTSSQNAEKAIYQNIGLAGDCMVAMKMRGNVQRHVINDQTALILNRFEILEDTRDNRYGFTQIRFG